MCLDDTIAKLDGALVEVAASFELTIFQFSAMAHFGLDGGFSFDVGTLNSHHFLALRV